VVWLAAAPRREAVVARGFPPGARKRGFALPTVVMTIAILTVVMVGATLALESYRARAGDALGDANLQTRALTAEAYIGYLAATQPFNSVAMDVGGLGSATGGADDQLDEGETLVRLDGRPYFWNEDDAVSDSTRLVVRLQDEAGLYNFSSADLDSLTYLFNNLGVDETVSPLLAQEVIDYNTNRTNPATPMRSLAELYSLADANVLTPPMRAKLREISSFQPNNNTENINTAPRLVLQSWFNLGVDEAQLLIDTRAQTPYTNIGQAAVVTTATNATYVLPTGRIRLTITDPRTGRSVRSTIVLTSSNTERPFWIENRQSLTLDPIPASELLDAETIPAIPPPST
jgi:hypothetical protein